MKISELYAIMDRNDRERQQRTIAEKLDATFGPNLCKQRYLYGPNAERAELICDLKRCIYCGPRKEMTMMLQLEAAFGELIYVGRTMSRAQIDTALERDKKARQRGAEGELLYQIVGDAATGFIIVSNRPLVDSQRRMRLRDWTKRIIDAYHHAGQRIRRSLAIGRLSLVPPRRGRKQGHPSSDWLHTLQLLPALPPDEWAVWEDETGALRSTLDMGYRPPGVVPAMSRPVPF